MSNVNQSSNTHDGNLHRSCSVGSSIASTTHSKTTGHGLPSTNTTHTHSHSHDVESKTTLTGSVMEKTLDTQPSIDSFSTNINHPSHINDSEKGTHGSENLHRASSTKEPVQISSLLPASNHEHRRSREHQQYDYKNDCEKGFCSDDGDSSLPDRDNSGSDPKAQGHHSGDSSPLCTWAELPAWMQDNPAILTGYRRETFSYRKSIASLGYLHNESVNIWSHLLGAITFIILIPIAYFQVVGVLDTVQWTDIAVFYAFIAGAIICLSMSASFHTFTCHSEAVSGQWNRCDYVGIVFLSVGSFYPAIFYGFYCHKTWQIMYIALTSTFGGATIIAVLQPRFRTPQFRWVRSGLFLALGLSALFPVIHAILLYGFAMARSAVALDYMFCVGAAYVIGALIYGSRVPECFFPGKFDHFVRP
ncbi:hypothetical protein BGZ94_005068 [Podila epigama]|nr:hypothetical protein BGZ94_005068 [Podila epigama]